jgi:hypothetical protein
VVGVNCDTAASATSTTCTGETWQFDVSCLKKFRAELHAVSGGTVTVTSTAGV